MDIKTSKKPKKGFVDNCLQAKMNITLVGSESGGYDLPIKKNEEKSIKVIQIINKQRTTDGCGWQAMPFNLHPFRRALRSDRNTPAEERHMGTEKLATILLVEDDIITALFERETLEAHGYSVLVAKSGKEAVELAESAQSIDLVLMDINLGSDLDGVETASLINRSRPMPVVFMSSHTDEATLSRLEGIDAYGYVVKGSTDAVLCTAVSMALRRAKAEKAATGLLQAEQAQALAESELRIKEAHHRVRNNISSIRAIMSLQLSTARHPETTSALQDAIGRIEGMSSLYEMLTGEEHGGNIDVVPYVDSLIETITPLFSNAPDILIEKQVDNFSLDPKRMFALGIIINELLTNVMKYAFSGKDRGLVRLNITVYDETVILTLRDDGNGLPGDFELDRSSGLGLSLIKMLLEQFGGTLAMRSDRGTTSTVLIQAPGLRLKPADETRHLAGGSEQSAVA